MASVRKASWTYKGITKEAWVCEYTDPSSGKRRRVTPATGLKKDADAIKRRVEREVEEGIHTPANQAITVAQALDLYFEVCGKRMLAGDDGAMRPMTLQVRQARADHQIRPQIGRMKLTELSAPVLQKWLDDLAYNPAKPLKQASIAQTLSILRKAIDECQNRELIRRNILREARLRLPGKPATKTEIPTKAEIGAIFAVLKQPRRGVCRRRDYLRPFLNMAVFTGLRQGELRALTWPDIDLAKSLVRVRSSVDIKGRVHAPKSKAGVRDVPLGSQLVLMLKEWKLACPPSERGLVFPSRSLGFVPPAAIHQSWCRLQVGLGWGGHSMKSKYRFHSLRHVAASLFIEAGLPPKRIQVIMGHASIQMTFDTYGHLFEDDTAVRAAMERIGEAFGR